MTQFSDYQLDQMFRDYLDECHEDIEIFGCKYLPSRTLYEVDPVAYREHFNNWLDMELTEEILFEHADGSIHDEEEETDEQPA